MKAKVNIEPCRSINQYNAHLDTVVYYRPWRNFFRKTYVIRCWTCDLWIAE